MSSALNQATSLPARIGPKPMTGTSMPHQQLDDNAPADIQEKLFERARSLNGVRIGPSRVSLPGARAFFMEDTSMRECRVRTFTLPTREACTWSSRQR